MDKSCKRCESEGSIEGLPIGQTCLDKLRAELASYEETLKASEIVRLEKAREDLLTRLGPMGLDDLHRIENRLSELEAELEAEKAKQALETELANLENEKMVAEVESIKVENEKLAEEIEAVDAILRQVDNLI